MKKRDYSLLKKDSKGRFAKIRFDRFCLDCKKKLSGYKSKRCIKCSVKDRVKRLPSTIPKHNKSHSTIAKIKMSKSHIGKGLWLGQSRNLPTGENHWNWKGGKTKLAEKIRKCEKYKRWRMKVFKRDKFICQYCEKRGSKIDAHHKFMLMLLLKYNNINSLKDAYKCNVLWDIDNGVTLCKECHKKSH